MFISSELMNPEKQRLMKLPLNFISFAIVEGKMFKNHGGKGSFTVGLDKVSCRNGTVTYGAIFALSDFNFYISVIDAYMNCSKSRLLRNHSMDMNHRKLLPVKPIVFTSLQHLSRLMYNENKPINVHVYMGNIDNAKVNRRINEKKTTYKVKDGIDAINFKKLYKEVTNDKQ